MKLWKPRFHGNGFIQVYLTSDTRLHIWSPKFEPVGQRRVENAQVHDHRFWFTSKILLGALENTDWAVIRAHGDNDRKAFQHGLWQQGPGHSDKSSPLEKIDRCALVSPRTRVYRAGDEYPHGGPGRFHDTRPADLDELTVTLMTKGRVFKDYRAQIVALNDETPDHAFEEQPSEEALRAEVLRVMGELM